MQQSTKSSEIIILGAGLAGLGAALNLPGAPVIESESTVGGHARSKRKQGFTFDEGIHVYFGRDAYVAETLRGLPQLALEDHHRDAWIFHHGLHTRYPFQANTFGLPLDVVKRCVLGFVENRFPPEAVGSYKDWLLCQYGEGICEEFMFPYSKKFWGVDPEHLTTEWVDVRHPRPSLEEIIVGAVSDQTASFGPNSTFSYPRQGGFGSIGESLADAVGRDRIELGRRVTKIDPNERVVYLNGGESRRSYRWMISTLPLPVVVGLLPEVPDSVADAVARLRTNSIMVVNLGVAREDVSPKHWIYYPETDVSFFRVCFPGNFGEGLAPPGVTPISCEVSYAAENGCDPGAMTERVIQDLKRVGVLRSTDEVVFQDTIDIRRAYVIFDEERSRAVRTIHEFLRHHRIEPAGRYGEWDYFWSHEAVLSGRRAALAVRSILQANQ